MLYYSHKERDGTDAAVALQSVDAGIPQKRPPANQAAERLLVFLPNESV